MSLPREHDDAGGVVGFWNSEGIPVTVHHEDIRPRGAQFTVP